MATKRARPMWRERLNELRAELELPRDNADALRDERRARIAAERRAAELSALLDGEREARREAEARAEAAGAALVSAHSGTLRRVTRRTRRRFVPRLPGR